MPISRPGPKLNGPYFGGSRNIGKSYRWAGGCVYLVSNLDHNFLLPSLTFIFSWPPLFVFVSLRFPPPHARFFLREKRKTSWLGRVFVVGRQQKRERKRKRRKGRAARNRLFGHHPKKTGAKADTERTKGNKQTSRRYLG